MRTRRACRYGFAVAVGSIIPTVRALHLEVSTCMDESFLSDGDDFVRKVPIRG